MANILVIENELVILNLISTVLRADGHNVEATSDPLMALDILTTTQRPFDLVLTEVIVKPITGFEVVKRLSKTAIPVPVLFMSALPALYGTVVDTLGRRWMLKKPFTGAQLRNGVSRALYKTKAKSQALTAQVPQSSYHSLTDVWRS